MDIIGGYRLIRRLGAGERAEVFLGHTGLTESAQWATAAIKIFKPGVAQQSIDQEVTVLSRTSSRHLLRLSDVTTGPHGRQCLVFPRLGGGSLARLLADRLTLEHGEIVTILAPIAEAIAELHDARCFHGALRPGSVMFDEAGAPIVVRFGRASTFGTAPGGQGVRRSTAAELMTEPGVADDLQHLRTLAETLIARHSPGESTGRSVELMEWLGAAKRSAEAPTFARELHSRLFELAQAMPIGVQPVRLAALGSTIRVNHTSMIASAEDDVITADPMTAEVVRARPSTVLRLPRRLAVILRYVGTARAQQRAIALLRKAAETMRTVRRPFRVAAGVGLAAVVLTLVLIPSTMGSHEAQSGAATVKSAASVSAHRPGSRPSQQPGASASTSATASKKAEKSIDDPVAAAAVLVVDRQRCFRKRSVACLNSVDQRGSSSWEDDSYLIRSLQEGGIPVPASLAGRTFVLAERLGDSALLTAEAQDGADAQSMLIIKGESGWRIRDILAG